ncbi:MAG: hypothetical protein IJ733_20840 [Lachnospiraceae bacterium]|nr:hypothetical protein [Lachnospiraceae bacterium]
MDSEGNIKSYALSIAVRLWKNEKRKYARRRRLAPSFSYEEGVEHGDFTSLAAARGSKGRALSHRVLQRKS